MERFFNLLPNIINRSLRKYKDSHLNKEMEEHSKIQWIKDCLRFSQKGHAFGYSSETLLILIVMVALYL